MQNHKLVLSFHSKSQGDADKILNYLKGKQCNVVLISENQPEKLSLRSKLIQNCDAFLAITSRTYQRSVECMELIHYAKDLKKYIYPINTDSNYIPFGGLGAISAGTNFGIINLTEEERFSEALDSVITNIEALKAEKKISTSDDLSGFMNDLNIEPSVNLKFIDEKFDIIISYHSECEKNADIIIDAFVRQEMNFFAEEIQSGESRIKSTKVLVIIMSPEYEANYSSKLIAETARSMNIPIIPISTNKKWKPQNWLGLITAGKLFYRIIDREQAYTKKHDSTPINDFVVAVIVAKSPVENQNEIEKSIIKSLNDQIAECKAKLATWPPKKRKRVKPERNPVLVEPRPISSEISFSTVHYKVTRADNPFSLYQLFDHYGMPIRQKFDSMISYQWDFQNLVLDIYYDLHVRNLKVWFDIWGGMKGNSNESMATAIQCSRVILIFLSDSYQKSVNCQLEFKYAVMCGKPFIFIRVHDNITISDWIEPHYNKWPKFDIKKIEDITELVNNVPRVALLIEGVREIGLAQPDIDDYELNDEIIELKELLNDALDDIADSSNQDRHKICTRCNKKYDQTNIQGCSYHTGYYVGGTLIAGRWVCCDQREKDTQGCRDTSHIDIPRELVLDENYGTYTWKPA